MKEQLYYGAKYTLCYWCILYYGEYWGRTIVIKIFIHVVLAEAKNIGQT